MDFIYEANRIYINDNDGHMQAEVTFPCINETTVDINHTFVDPSLRGQGIAGKLMKAAYEKMKIKKLLLPVLMLSNGLILIKNTVIFYLNKLY